MENDTGSMPPAPGGVGLLIIDMINGFAFEGGEDLRPKVRTLAEKILRLRQAADRAGAPVIYVNDNYGYWRESQEQIVQTCAKASEEAAAAIELLSPRPQDFFVIKPQVSGFYSTSLPVLLPKLYINRVVLTGVAADI